MHFDLALIPVLVLGGALLVLAGRIAIPNLSSSATPGRASVRLHGPVHVWVMRFAGILILAFGAFIATNPRVKYRTLMSKDENKLALLERGQVTEGKATKAYYRRAAPAGWAVYYTFTVRDVSTTAAKQFSGNSHPHSVYNLCRIFLYKKRFYAGT